MNHHVTLYAVLAALACGAAVQIANNGHSATAVAMGAVVLLNIVAASLAGGR